MKFLSFLIPFLKFLLLKFKNMPNSFNQESIPDDVLVASKLFLDSQKSFFSEFVKASFKAINMIGEQIGCFSTVVCKDKEYYFSCYKNVDGTISVTFTLDINCAKKLFPYKIDLNKIHQSIKLSHSKLYRNNITFYFIDNELKKVTLNQSIQPNGSDEISYVLYDKNLHEKFNLDEHNSLNFYIFNHLKKNTLLIDILNGSDISAQFSDFVSNYSDHINILKMYNI